MAESKITVKKAEDNARVVEKARLEIRLYNANRELAEAQQGIDAVETEIAPNTLHDLRFYEAEKRYVQAEILDLQEKLKKMA